MNNILQQFLSIPPREASFARRKFHFLRDSARQQLERVGKTFLHGYHLALTDRGIEPLGESLNEIESEFRGYGFEGAAMALDILDQVQPWKACRISKFLRGPGNLHVYMVHVGIGWSMARWRLGIIRRLARLDPLLRWLAIDGFGFHEGYFHWPRCSGGARPPFAKLRGYGLRAFDQGLGRSLWFVGGADPEYIASAISRFPESRHCDLWSGVGLACTYAGGTDETEVRMLRRLSGSHWLHVGQGAVFAAGARYRSETMSVQTELGCQVFCEMSARRAAEVCERTLRDVAEDADPAYEVWRRLIRTHLEVSEDLNQNIRIGPSRGASSSVQSGVAHPQ